MTLGLSIRLAWRNVWRQKRRTLVTASAISMALLLSLLLRSMQEGSYANNLDNATRFYSGYLQLQHPEFADNQSIDKLLPGNAEFAERILAIEGVTTAVPRLESFALGAAGERSKGVMVMGVDPVAENAYSHLAQRVRTGRDLSEGEKDGALVGGRLAQYFGLQPGDELVLYGQGYHGTTAAGLFRVAGILNYPSAQLDARIVYLPLSAAQRLYGTPDLVSSWVLHGRNVRVIPQLEKSARALLEPEVRVRNWAEISPELAQQIAMDRVSGQILILILYGVVGFSLFATIVMLTLERQREFAVMLAAGMPRRKLQWLVMLEATFLALTGALFGFLAALPLLLWFHAHPIQLGGDLAVMMEEMGFEAILPFALRPELFVGQLGIVLLLLFLCLGYPLVRIGRLQIAAAMKG